LVVENIDWFFSGFFLGVFSLALCVFGSKALGEQWNCGGGWAEYVGVGKSQDPGLLAAMSLSTRRRECADIGEEHILY